jgi:hypothetical protein
VGYTGVTGIPGVMQAPAIDVSIIPALPTSSSLQPLPVIPFDFFVTTPTASTIAATAAKVVNVNMADVIAGHTVEKPKPKIRLTDNKVIGLAEAKLALPRRSKRDRRVLQEHA